MLFQWLYSSQPGKNILSRLFKDSPWFYLLVARTLRQQGNDHDAFMTLMMGQRCPIDDYRIHIRLSELYRDNGDVLAAHTHLKVADVLKFGYSTIRLLTFESDHGLHEEGSKTMARVLKFSPRMVRRHMMMLNRISIYYPEHGDRLNTVRQSLKKSLQTSSYPNSGDLSGAVNTAISNRWLHIALNLSNNRNSELDTNTRSLLTRLTEELGAHQLMLDLAWENETAEDLTAIFRHQSMPLKDVDIRSHRVVELFIPTPFFASPDTEKPTYATIRKTFVEAIRFLMGRKDLVIVPRFQLYWKYCLPKTKSSRVISYHTRALFNPQHLHNQEMLLMSENRQIATHPTGLG